MAKSSRSSIFLLLKSFFFLFLSLLPLSSSAQNNQNAIPEEIQKFLNTSAWVFTYRVSLNVSGSGDGVSGSIRQDIDGKMELGLRAQGPSLSAQEAIGSGFSSPADLAKFSNFISNYANWMYGFSYDEPPPGGDPVQAMMQNVKAQEKLHYDFQSDGRTTADGKGEVMLTGNFAFEIDGAKRKFNLRFEPNFADSDPNNPEPIHVEAVSSDGKRQNSTRSFSSMGHQITSMEPPWDKGPGDANIVGNLPAAYGAISGQSKHKVHVTFQGLGMEGTYIIDYIIAPKSTSLEELIIIPPNNYYDWRPLAGKNEKESGDWVPVQVRLQKAGGGEPKFKADKITFRLKDTSRVKGICMNAPLEPDPDNPFDLQIEADQNPDFIIKDAGGQEAALTGEDMTEAGVIISSFDYGAYGDLEVEAELSNGEHIKGVVVGTSGKKLKLPDRADDSHIANVFLKNLSSSADNDDNEVDPEGDGFTGDGLSLYEEYRGFKNGKGWITADPQKKDVFIYNEMRGDLGVMRGINIFKKATGLVVHKDLLKKQVRDDMVINFNNDPDNHIIDQHVIRIKSGPTRASGATAAFVEEVGTPGTAKSVNIPPDWEDYRLVQEILSPSKERVVAHEMSHDVNVSHHGEEDEVEHWFLQNDGKFVARKVVFDQGSFYPLTGSVNEEITVKLEDGTVLSKEEVLGAGKDERYVTIGVKHGQHSGAENCLMRYWFAYAYISDSDPKVRYLSPGEFTGAALCKTADGTGVNDPSHIPESRYGSAATPANGGPNGWVKENRGNCIKQIRVNDLGEEPHR